MDIKIDPSQLPNVTYHRADISCLADIKTALHQLRPDVIFHTASPTAFAHNLDFFLKINVEGTRNLLEAAQEVGCVKAFIYTSSASVIHDSVSDLHDADDTWPVLYMPVQRSEYSHTKALAEDIVLRANRQSHTLTLSLRPSGMFGEEDQTTVKPMVEAAASGKYKYQIGSGKNLFDWTYIGNVAQAHVDAAYALLEAHGKPLSSIPTERRVDGETFLITNDEPVAFWDFARSLGAAAGYPTKVEDVRSIPRLVGLAMAYIAEWAVWIVFFGQKKSAMSVSGIRYSTTHRTFCVDKAKKRLHYQPEVDMAEGIRRAGESFSKKRV